MFPNSLASENLAVLATFDPISQGAATVTTGWVSMAKFAELVAILQTGVMGGGGTLDAKLQQATDAAGTGAKDLVPAKALVQILKAAGDNKQALINVRPEQLDVNNNFAFVRLSITVGTAASLISAILLGVWPRQGTAADSNQAGVVQIVP